MCTSTLPLEPTTTSIRIPLAAARRGDSDAFEALISPHTSRLQRLARRFTRNLEDAEDICQESLLKAFLKLDQFDGTKTEMHEFRAWLMKITANCAIDFLRRKQGDRLLPLEESTEAANKSHQTGKSGWGESPEASYVRHQELATVAEAVADLPGELRNVCFLRNKMELSTKEVAARLGISALAVRLRLFRAHGQLRKQLNRRSEFRSARSSDRTRRRAA